MDSLKEYLNEMVKRGYSNLEILTYLEKDIDLAISERSLKRWLQLYGIKRHDGTVTPLQVSAAIEVYTKMWE